MKRQAVVCLIVALSALFKLPVTEGKCDSSQTNKFGPQCEHTCRCIGRQASLCREDGICSNNDCQDGYFGTRCQYRNIAANPTNPRFTDFNVETCNLNEMSEVSIYAETTPFNFTWLRVSGDLDTLQSLTIDWENTDGSVVPCTNFVKRRVVQGSSKFYTMDFDCLDISKPIKRIILRGTIERIKLCSTYMSDKRNCPSGWFGLKCEHKCRCSFEFECQDDGTCLSSCQKGWFGPVCQNKCSLRTWGEDCKEACDVRCVDQLCHHVNGACDDCQPGKGGHFCEHDCEDFTYGRRCVHQCSEKCSQDVPCDKRDGNCRGVCSPGYLGQFCDQQCQCNTYGLNCSKTCSPSCLFKASSSASDTPRRCHPESGACLYGCLDGYEGVTCSERVSDGIPVGAIIGLVIVIVLLIVALVTVVWLCRKRQKATKEPHEPYY
ncbi:multiple epidermal growth factor-like domains protein 11 [Aplysia californica]|uniref:Multiple epidermal growth factor-like domains protein 11 n=1 Tax=Aplysia californica TaxID=6500 RepID=A0ABM0JHS7_APLCA|nr:multiple epidermal growth factor-like domains protein 11 [Aplysia californica]